ERFDRFPGARKARRDLTLEATCEPRIERRTVRRPALARDRDVAAHDHRAEMRRRLRSPEIARDEDPKRDETERPNVGAGPDEVDVSNRLLGRHERRRAHHEARLRLHRAFSTREARDPEVEELDAW